MHDNHFCPIKRYELFYSLLHRVLEKGIYKMDEDQILMTPFDTMITDNSLQMIKAILPYLSQRNQQLFSMFVKTRELANTMSLFRDSQNDMKIMSAGKSTAEPMELLNEMRPYINTTMKNQIDQMLFFIQALQIMQYGQSQDEELEDTKTVPEEN